MNYNQLSLEQAPGIATPLRFFLTAPLFGIVACIVLLYNGPDILQNRWLPETLALTHLITLGFINMVMMGALLQILPVLAGSNVPAASIVSTIVHVLYTIGIFLLTLGLGINSPQIISLSLFTLLPGLLIYLIAVSFSLFKAQSKQASAQSMRFAVLSLWIAIILGITLASGHASDTVPLLRQLTPIHIAWATIGWITMMVISVSYQVIPMFQVTNEYPALYRQYLALFIIFSLVNWSLVKYFYFDLGAYAEPLILFFTGLIILLILSFVVITIRLQFQRKKRLADASIYFWLTGLFNLMLCLLAFIVSEVLHYDLSILIAILFFTGFIISVINGMLYKIVPFLVWLHLNKNMMLSSGGRRKVPTMNEVINTRKSFRQFYLHLTALILTILCVFSPEYFFYPAAILWLLNWGVLWIHLFQAILLYQSCLESK